MVKKCVKLDSQKVDHIIRNQALDKNDYLLIMNHFLWPLGTTL